MTCEPLAVRIAHGRLKELVNYNPETGRFTSLTDRGKVRVGYDLGCVSKSSGYVYIRIDRVLYSAHVLAWFYMTGGWPTFLIDHADNNKSNNTWNNLRRADRTQNQANSRLYGSNKTGRKGVAWNDKAKKFEAYISKDRRKIHLGLFNNLDDASEAYDQMAAQLFDSFALTNAKMVSRSQGQFDK